MPAAATTCEGITSKSTCMSTSEAGEHCAWCTSGAVGNSCLPETDAKGLPVRIFEYLPIILMSLYI